MHPRAGRGAIFFHPDFTVGAVVSTAQPSAIYCRWVADYTAGWDFHPTLKIQGAKIYNNYINSIETATIPRNKIYGHVVVLKIRSFPDDQEICQCDNRLICLFVGMLANQNPDVTLLQC